MDAVEEAPDVDPLFVGLTRPAMVFGVTYSYFIVTVMITAIGFLGTNSLFFFLAAVPIHGLGYAGCAYDPRIFDLTLKRFSKCPPVRNAGFWKCNTYEPY